MHLSGLTMRVHVVQQLIEILRASGYPGYEAEGVNSRARVAQRLSERYHKVYGDATFMPAAVKEAIRTGEKTTLSLVQDKVATPSEALQSVEAWDRTARPQHIVAERSVRSQSNLHENYAAVFSKYGDLRIQTGTTMTNQFVPWYLGMAFPFTLPCAVGGYDVPHQPRWRRPADEDLPLPRATMEVWQSHSVPSWKSHSVVGPACHVRLFDGEQKVGAAALALCVKFVFLHLHQFA